MEQEIGNSADENIVDLAEVIDRFIGVSHRALGTVRLRCPHQVSSYIFLDLDT